MRPPWLYRIQFFQPAEPSAQDYDPLPGPRKGRSNRADHRTNRFRFIALGSRDTDALSSLREVSQMGAKRHVRHMVREPVDTVCDFADLSFHAFLHVHVFMRHPKITQLLARGLLSPARSAEVIHVGIFSEGKMLPVEGSSDQFRSWEGASQAGKTALKKLATRAGIW
jgi:hypothetical protein